MNWNGNLESLDIIKAPTPAPMACKDGQCPALTLDVYPLPGSRCEGDVVYRDVYMRGQGGNQVYTYYWDGQQIGSGPTNEGITFQVDNTNGPTLVRMAKVISGDGQEFEKQAYVADFDCSD